MVYYFIPCTVIIICGYRHQQGTGRAEFFGQVLKICIPDDNKHFFRSSLSCTCINTPCRHSPVPAVCELKVVHTRSDKTTTGSLHGAFWGFSISVPSTMSWKQTYSSILMQQNHSEASSTFKWQSFQSGHANPMTIVPSWDVTDSNTSPRCKMKLPWQMRDLEPLIPGSVLALVLHMILQGHIRKQVHLHAEQLQFGQLTIQQRNGSPC